MVNRQFLITNKLASNNFFNISLKTEVVILSGPYKILTSNSIYKKFKSWFVIFSANKFIILRILTNSIITVSNFFLAELRILILIPPYLNLSFSLLYF